MKRSPQQNKSLHKWCRLLSDELNEKGLEMKVVLDDDWEIWWTEEAVKDNLIRPLCKAMYGTTKTSELTTKQLSKVTEQLQKIIGEKHGIDIPFPSVEELMREEYDN